jgi:hypothetical protein
MTLDLIIIHFYIDVKSNLRPFHLNIFFAKIGIDYLRLVTSLKTKYKFPFPKMDSTWLISLNLA